LSKGLLETITEFFEPQAPSWACEVTSRHVIIAGVNARRNRITDKSTATLNQPLALPSQGGKGAEIADTAGQVVRKLLSEVGFKGSEIAVVVPDETARIAFLTAENLSKNPEEQRTFIRWKLKKSIPFDVDSAQVAYRIQGTHPGGTGVDIVVALSPRSIVQEYEKLFDALDIHVGILLPSTLATLNLFSPPVGDTLFVKVAPDCVTTTVFQSGRVQFYRRVSDLSLYDAVYPTVLYYQDKLGGKALERMYVCGYDSDLASSVDEVQDKLGLLAYRIGPKSVEDIYKPALGAIHLKADATM